MLFKLEGLRPLNLQSKFEHCEQSVKLSAKTVAVAVAGLYHLSGYLTNDRVNVYEFSPVDLIAFSSARIAELTRLQDNDELHHVAILLAPFSSISEIEEILCAKI